MRRLRDRGNGDRQRYRWSMSDAVGRSETRVGSVTTAGIEGGIGGAQVAKISQEQKKLEVDREGTCLFLIHRSAKN